MPEDTDGTVNVALNAPDPSAYVVEICVEPRLMLTKPFGVKPEPIAVTDAPGRACVGTTVIEPIVMGGGVGVGVGEPVVGGAVGVPVGAAVAVGADVAPPWVTTKLAEALSPVASYTVMEYVP